ncbi:hypothetical protein ABEG17_08735 [Pedococcus sp. KACC 23699]|uniref:DUF2892 domain-containing protein n=1 Tax=Pedococcus sp. KACC 23699 TaxID=3149228 RepID=A0AAU7JYT1_9MICO
MTAADRFNSTRFSLWINSHRGRAFRLVAGLAWLAFAVVFRDHWWGVAAGVWSVLPLSAGVFDVCWVSAALGGPLAGRSIRAAQGRSTTAVRV